MSICSFPKNFGRYSAYKISILHLNRLFGFVMHPPSFAAALIAMEGSRAAPFNIQKGCFFSPSIRSPLSIESSGPRWLTSGKPASFNIRLCCKSQPEDAIFLRSCKTDDYRIWHHCSLMPPLIRRSSSGGWEGREILHEYCFFSQCLGIEWAYRRSEWVIEQNRIGKRIRTWSPWTVSFCALNNKECLIKI